MRRHVTVLALVVTLGLALSTHTVRSRAQGVRGAFPKVDVSEVILQNGFRMLVVEDHRVPRVAASIWYRVGSSAEAQGTHGSIHFLEHVVHQGTNTVGTRDFQAELPILREIQETERQLQQAMNRERKRLRESDVFYDELTFPSTPEIDKLRQRLYELEDKDSEFRDFWAEYNLYKRYGAIMRHTDPVPATTSKEQLEIDLDLPVENIELFFRLEADRMVNAVLRGWEAQRYTVFEQRLGRQGRPETRFDYEAFEAVTAPFHPSYHPSGGHLRDFAFFTREKMLRMYDEHFVPNNATLALVGDITPDRARTLAEKYFARPARGPEPEGHMDVEASPVPGGAVRLDWMEPLTSRVMVRFRIPAIGHPDRPAFDLMSQVLSDRLADAVAGERGASSIDASAGRRGAVSTFTIDAYARRDEDLPPIESAILTAVQQLHDVVVPDEALARARKALRLQWERTRMNRGDLAFTLGHFEVMDSWRTLQAHLEAREAATGADLQRLARKYFIPANRVVGTARRQPLDRDASRPVRTPTEETQHGTR